MRPVEDRFRKGDEFVIDGVSLDRILADHTTPFYVYSGSMIRDRYRELTSAFPGFDVLYSVKANPNPEICRILARLGAGAEISSMLELRTALDAGYAADDIIFVGPAKTEADINLALESGIYAVVCDSAEDLRQVDRLAAGLDRIQRVLLRINTVERPASREAMVGGPSKFGFDEEKVVEQVRGLELRHVRIAGIQVYSASQVLDPGFLSSHLEYVLGLGLHLSAELDLPLEAIDFGGGFGVAYEEDETELDLAPVSETAAGMLETHAGQLRGCRLLLESGRFIVAESGVFLTTVARTKQSRGTSFVVCDAGMNAFARPVFMKVRHPIRLLNRIAEPAAGEFRVCGPICTPIDCIGQEVHLPDPRPGDSVGVFNAGAYGWSMSLKDFMSLPHPSELLADNGNLTVIRD
ncbi:MAG: diaminopimelate decarboxylase [candidate division WOR-3 bacterium]|nr:MAG: diaminopimelate decarboxylase [candidate division WOR-3 bacterium]